jgi:DivIVA domain-containing protein
MDTCRLQEISLRWQAEERLTPDVVQAVSFRTVRRGRRGFDEEHVRAFCQQVEEELVTLHNERMALQQEINRLRRRVLGICANAGEAGYRRDDGHVQAVGILSRAQETASHYVAEAQEYSRHLAEDARRRRDEILAQARWHAALVLEEAHHEASCSAQAPVTEPVAEPVTTAPVAEPEADGTQLEAELARLRACLKARV